MISILIWCYSRQKHLDQTLPRWLAQIGAPFEVVLGHGPDIRWPKDPRIVPVPTPRNKTAESYNAMLAAAAGEVLLITQADMLPMADDQLARMAARWHPGAIVHDNHYRQTEPGGLWYEQDNLYSLQLVMLARQDVVDVGAWWPGWDDPRVCAHEDGDMILRLMERGLVFEFMETPFERGVRHIYHERPAYTSPKTKKGRDNPYFRRQLLGSVVFWHRHDKHIAKQHMAAQFIKLRLQREMGITGRTTPAKDVLGFDPGMIVQP